MNSMIVSVHIHKYQYNHTYIFKQVTAMTLKKPLPVQIILIVMC